MKTVLILMGRYLPGFKDGGPVRTIINLTEALGDEYDFRIIALDRDHGDEKPYDNIKYNEWNTVGKAKVRYVEPYGFSFKLIREAAKQADVVYTCGFFNDYGYKTLILNRLGRLYKRPVTVASMGTFSKGALAQKSAKKKIFITLCKALGLFKNITWSVTSELEAADLQNSIGQSAKYVIAEDLPRVNVPGINEENKKTDALKIVFLSRISPKKNLLGAIRILSSLKCQVEFSICGPDEDKEYWKTCQNELAKLPKNIKWQYKGNVPSETVQQELSNYDVFLFPTLGENFGHVIFEALSAGCIPVISDTTPWLDFEQNNCGIVLPLEKPEPFTKALEDLAQMSEQELITIKQNAVNYARRKTAESLENTGYRKIFNS